MKTDVKPCMSQDCKKKIHVCFTEKRITLCVL